ncbi:hypothetical protein E2C01_030474 [Portunus trituberculatus]|uniref:Uncharacterized protein n=1 Tax=Portunus trituberculatus TaxID=210409 RepID=A0A5B7ES55_PORTR|nr:hypothetical protein [Portunus trituberculatus]
MSNQHDTHSPTNIHDLSPAYSLSLLSSGMPTTLPPCQHGMHITSYISISRCEMSLLLKAMPYPSICCTTKRLKAGDDILRNV